MSRTAPADHAAQRVVLDRIGSLEREQAVLYARQARARAELSALFGADQGVIVELAGTARIGQDRASGQLTRAERLVSHFPIALGLLELGVMRVGTVEIVLEVTKSAPAEVQRELDGRLSERLCPMDAVDVRRLVARTLLEVEGELDEAALRERYDKARANRGVWAFGVQDGMARIGAELDEVKARRWVLDFDELVRAQKTLDARDGIVRTQAQRRADVFAMLPSQILALADAAAHGRLGELLAQVAATRAQADGTPPETAGPGSDLGMEQPGLFDEVLVTGLPEDPETSVTPEDIAAEEEHPVRVPTPVLAPRNGADDASGTQRMLLDLLRLPVRNPAMLLLHTPMTTMLDLDQRSGWLEGIGPVPAMRARMLLATASLRRVAVDERTGVPLGMDPHVGVSPPWHSEVTLPPRHRRRSRPQRSPETAAAPPEQVMRERLLTIMAAPMYLTDRAEPQHDPSTAVRAFTRVRDLACDGPGCPRTATACHLDHEHPYAQGGVTASWNLRNRSARCHHCKHDGWTVVHDHDTGASEWTSPAGSRFTRRGPWQPPIALPEDLQLPEPRLIEPRDLAPDWREDDSDQPLWRDPETPAPRERRARRQVWDPDKDPVPPWHRTDHPTSDKPDVAPRPASWDDGPPPF